MYAIHTTPGFIIESRPRGEAGKLLSIFTRDLGLVLASAQGIRLEKSKLRYHAQTYMLGEYSFVRGSEFWRLTNADGLRGGEARDTVGTRKRDDGLTQRIALVLKRLLHGEDPHTELFDCVRELLLFLGETDEGDLTALRLEALESLAIFRVVRMLGYVGATGDIPAELVGSPPDTRLLDVAARHRTALNLHINRALRESQL